MTLRWSIAGLTVIWLVCAGVSPPLHGTDFVGYVPTEEAFGPHGGGYETRLTSCTNLEVQAGRQIVDAALELAARMKPGELPLPPRAPQGQPWTYGNVPPELQ